MSSVRNGVLVEFHIRPLVLFVNAWHSMIEDTYSILYMICYKSYFLWTAASTLCLICLQSPMLCMCIPSHISTKSYQHQLSCRRLQFGELLSNGEDFMQLWFFFVIEHVSLNTLLSDIIDLLTYVRWMKVDRHPHVTNSKCLFVVRSMNWWRMDRLLLREVPLLFRKIQKEHGSFVFEYGAILNL